MALLDLRKHADAFSSDSLSNRLRSRRFQLFAGLLDRIERPIRILDVGGTYEFWKHRGWIGKEGVEIHTVNIDGEEGQRQNLIAHRGDATRLDTIGDHEFDVAFSNSVIEHVFTLANQRAMAAEVRRVSRAYWVQTPNFWFPVEPHFHKIGWQWLPRDIRVSRLRKSRCGWRGPIPDLEKARLAVDEVRLMKSNELRSCFPGAKLWRERVYGLTKSFVVYDGFGASI